MRIIFDLNHPAHVHFFRQPMALLRDRGHELLVASREKDVAIELLSGLGIEHVTLSTQSSGGAVGLIRELIQRDWALWRLARRWRADCLTAIGGTFSAHAGVLARIPSLVFYDTENARMQNAITYPLASHVYVPRCYQAWLPKKSSRYAGYHELSYLHPNYFEANRDIAIANGLAESGPTFLLRTLSWQANHDVGENSWSPELLAHIVTKLASRGQVLISAEGDLEPRFEQYRYSGDPTCLHHVMAHCAAYVGESATMASECAVLGVPSIYSAETGRGYMDEQEQRYGLVRNMPQLDWKTLEPVIDELLAYPPQHWQKARQALLEDTIDVAAFVADAIECFPNIPLDGMR